MDEYATIYGIKYHIIGNIHDEIQTEVREDQAEQFGRLATSCVEAAGLFTNSTALSQETTKSETLGQTRINPLTGKPMYYKDNPITKKAENAKQMHVNGKYVSKKHPLYKAGNYKGFEDAAFSSLENFKDSPQGQVYILTNPAWEGWVKVGMAVDAVDRTGNYQTSSPYRDYELGYVVEYTRS